MLAKAMETYVCHDMKEWEELVDIVTMQKNRFLVDYSAAMQPTVAIVNMFVLEIKGSSRP